MRPQRSSAGTTQLASEKQLRENCKQSVRPAVNGLRLPSDQSERMSDNLTERQRRHCMSRIRSENTHPEMIVRREAHRLGYRYRLHDARLPGCPDLVFPKRRKVILVHGCFWHRHSCRAGRVVPVSNRRYWVAKLTRNHKRDLEVRRRLRRSGWTILVIWECELKDPRDFVKKLRSFLGKMK